MGGLRRVSGSVVVVPAVVLLCGSSWSWWGRVVDHRLLLPVLWGAWIGLRLASARWPAPRRILAGWERADLWIATLLVHSVVFHLPGTPLFALATLVPVLGLVQLARRAPLATSVYAAVLGAFFYYVVPEVFAARIIARIAEQHDLSVDHRLIPDGEEINPDRIRFRGRSEDLFRDDFVVVFLGDSFTYGWRLGYEETLPSRFQAFAAEGRCSSPVRAVNFGWVSSSPLLSLRLLREIGYRYKPDLVVYDLDMSDFHDDLRYEHALRSRGDLTVDWVDVTNRAVNAVLPGFALDVREWLRAARPRGELRGQMLLPAERYFVTGHPLEETRPFIERGVMKNLAAIDRFVRDVLDARFALVVLPRSYQYSDREAPENWEAWQYRRHGPHVREPFRYFQEVADRLPYPVIDLLPVFEGSEEFPLFHRDDPHWNPRGAELAARAVGRRLEAEGLLPCRLGEAGS